MVQNGFMGEYMKDNYLFHGTCKEVDKFESKVKGWSIYPRPVALSGVYLDLMGDDGDCYDGIYVTSVRQAKVFLKSCEEFLKC